MATSSDVQPKRRERGIFERPKGSGTWWVRYTDEHGRLHREKVGPKALALRVYQKRKTEVYERRFFPDRIRRRDLMVADVIDDYLARVKGRLKSYRNCLRYGELWKTALAGKSLRQVVPGDIERFISDRLKSVSKASVNRELFFLKRVYNVAIADGEAEVNPANAVKTLKENNQRLRYLTEDEEQRLRKVLGDEDRAMVAVAVHTGLRQSEEFQLKWENVDFATGIITIPESKSGATRRLPMNDTVREVLRTRPSRLKSAYVFPSKTGQTAIIGRNYTTRVFVPALRRAGIENFRWHDLRHTFASRLVMAGVDLRTVQELMGHKTIAMTLRYSHLSPEHQLDAVQRLNRSTTDTTTGTGI